MEQPLKVGKYTCIIKSETPLKVTSTEGEFGEMP